MPGLQWSFFSILLVYGLLGAVTWFVVVRLIRANERGETTPREQDESASELAKQGAHG